MSAIVLPPRPGLDDLHLDTVLTDASDSVFGLLPLISRPLVSNTFASDQPHDDFSMTLIQASLLSNWNRSTIATET